jgi:Zn-dependent protease with chaperone function
MDFFEAQDAARRNAPACWSGSSRWRCWRIVAVVYVVVHVAVGPGPQAARPVPAGAGGARRRAVIAGRHRDPHRQPAPGGPAVAELLGGRRVASPTPATRTERKLLNVVEEMAIASGTPVPAVYVLDARTGSTPSRRATPPRRGGRGHARRAAALTRDELQGVIAHEFSHILNGDMRLNIRLIGVLYGILLLAVIGRGIVYAGPRAGGRGRDGGAGWIVLLGLALLVVGYVGVFFGKLIKAAVSRQREYLADSAAVQFTRNPDGLAGALKKIGAQAHGSRIRDHHAEELSHLFFANGLRARCSGLATHPPLEERIRRLDPSCTRCTSAEPGAGHRPARA